MRRKESSISFNDIIFDEEYWIEEFEKYGRPEIEAAIEYGWLSANNRIGVDSTFDNSEHDVLSLILALILFFAKNTVELTFNDLKQVIEPIISKNKNIEETIEEIKIAINEVFKYSIDTKSASIARTEIMRAFNSGTLLSFRNSKSVRYKRWLTSRDEKVRHTHQLAEGQIRQLEEPFNVGKSNLMFPTDTSLGAELKETLNCRCVMMPEEKNKIVDNDLILWKNIIKVTERQEKRFVETLKKLFKRMQNEMLNNLEKKK